MIKLDEIPLFLFLLFTLVYATIGNPASEIWSGSYFFVNYLMMLFLFKDHKSKMIRIIGISLCFSIIIFLGLKYFFELSNLRPYTLIPFGICIFGLIKMQKKQ